jgi:hypothetical protein
LSVLDGDFEEDLVEAEAGHELLGPAPPSSPEDDDRRPADEEERRRERRDRSRSRERARRLAAVLFGLGYFSRYFRLALVELLPLSICK